MGELDGEFLYLLPILRNVEVNAVEIGSEATWYGVRVIAYKTKADEAAWHKLCGGV